MFEDYPCDIIVRDIDLIAPREFPGSLRRRPVFRYSLNGGGDGPYTE